MDQVQCLVQYLRSPDSSSPGSDHCKAKTPT